MSSRLDALPVYVPGRTVPGATKLASNETPYPPLPYVLERILESAQNMNRYPDTGAQLLTERLGEKFDVNPNQVAVGCGSVSLCAQAVLLTTDPGDEVIYAWRSFEAYPIVVALAGATARQIPLVNHVHDFDAMAAAINDRTRLIFVCNPNNPTGTAVGIPTLRAFFDRVPGDILIALDEAYIEFATDPELLDSMSLLADYPNLVILRTFSKAYGLAGLRIGYAVAADPTIATAFRQTQLPFVVTQVGQDAAVASLEPAAEHQLMGRVAELVGERERVAAALRTLGYEVPPTQANFVWLPLGERSLDWAAALAERKLIVRPFAGTGVRVTISTEQENDRVIEAARELTAS
jgi:histidinol-phosphate aminotransferase